MLETIRKRGLTWLTYHFHLWVPLPGERVQMDVCKIRPKAYQATAIDDCIRIKCIRIFKRKTVVNAVEFLLNILDDFPFAIQHVQTDWGTEFFNQSFQYELHEHLIKFRPIQPRNPHQTVRWSEHIKKKNGKSGALLT